MDADYERCRRTLEDTTEPIVIPAPVLVEVAYFIERRLSVAALSVFLSDISSGAFLVEDLVPADYARASALCAQYADSRIGFVDAAVLAVIEWLNEPKLATLDRRHFGMLRPRHVNALRLLPE